MIKTQSMTELYYEILNDENARVIPYGISENYVPNWTEVQALTEYVANFYDENNTNFTITEMEGGIILEDKSKRGIKLEDLIIGNSSSREYSYKIGTHGEGFKLGALALVRNGKIAIIKTIGYTIIFYLEYDKKVKSSNFKSKVIPSDDIKEGSRIYLETSGEILKEVKQRFLFLNHKLTKLTDFLYQSSYSDENQIYVNTLASQKITSYFSYSLFKKQIVNRDRNMLESPYEDILVELFSIKDKTVIKQWLSCMADSNFKNSFEFELLDYFTKHFRRKVLKDLDLSTFSEVAKEMHLQYIGGVESYKQKCYKMAHPEKYLITAQYGLLSYFCEKFLDIKINDSGLNYGFKNKGKYFLPIFDVRSANQNTTYDKILNLLHTLDSSSILKGVVLDGCNLIFTLKKGAENKIDFITGRTSKKNTHIRSVFSNLFHLNIDKNVSFLNFDFHNVTENGVHLISLESFPNSIELYIKDADVLESLNQNILFIDSKSILKDTAYELKEGKNFIIDSKYQISDKINSCFSYRHGYEQVTNIFSNSTIVKTLLERLKENPKQDDLYEFTLLSHLISNITASQGRYFYDTSKITKVLKEQFINVFGSKTVVSSSDDGDKQALYNDYHLIKFNSVLTTYFKTLKVCLSEQVKCSLSDGFDFIPKPKLENISELAKGEYRKVIASVTILQNVLNSLYEQTKNVTHDSKLDFIKAILPYYHSSNDLLSEETKVVLNNNNYKKVIKEYCYKILDHSFLTKNDPDLGFVSGGRIYVENSTYNHGTFFHEYVHFSTNLLDISEDFEKTLALVGILAAPFVKPSDKEVISFFEGYQKWLGVR